MEHYLLTSDEMRQLWLWVRATAGRFSMSKIIGEEAVLRESSDHWIDLYTKLMPRLASRLAGKKVTLPDIDADMAYQKTLEIFNIWREWFELESQGKLDRVARLEWWDRLIRTTVPIELPEEHHALGVLIASSAALPKIPQERIFLEETQLVTFITSLRSLVYRLSQMNKLPLVEYYLKSARETKDGIALSQALALRFEKHLQYLNRQMKRIERRTVKHFLDIYLDLAKMFEIQIRWLIGLLDIIQRKTPRYELIQGYDFRNNVKRISASHFVGDIGKAVDVTARNSIAHGTYHFNPDESTVTLRDRSDSITWKYTEFPTHTRNLCAAVVTLNSLSEIVSTHIFWHILNTGDYPSL